MTAVRGVVTDSGHAHAAAAEGEEALPLRAIMQQLGSDMTALTYALMVSDSAQLLLRSEAIAAHPHLLPSEVERISTALGPEMASFEAMDEEVHHTAERLHQAVLTGPPELIAERLGEVQRGCVSCHTKYRDRLRTDRP